MLAFSSAVTWSSFGKASSTNKLIILIVSDRITLLCLVTSWLANLHELLSLQELHILSSWMLKKARNLFDAKTVLRSTVGHPNKATFFKSLPDSHFATTWLSCPNRSAAALTVSGRTACGVDEKSGPGRYRPSWSRRSSAPASSSHGSLSLGLGVDLRHGGSSPEAGGVDGCFRSPKSEERFVGDRRFGWRKIEESFGAAAAVAEEESRRAAESAIALGFREPGEQRKAGNL